MKKNKDLILLEEIDKMRSMMGLLNEYAYPAVTKGIEEFFEYIFGRGTFDHVALGEKIKRFEESLTEFDKNLTLSKKLNDIGRKVEQGFKPEGRILLLDLLDDPQVYISIANILRKSNYQDFIVLSNRVVKNLFTNAGPNGVDMYKKALTLFKKKGKEKFIKFCDEFNTATGDKLFIKKKNKIFFDEFNPYFENIVPINVKGWSKWVTNLMENSRTRQTLRRMFANLNKSNEKLMVKFASYANAAGEKLNSSTGSISSINGELKAMADIIASLKKSEDKLATEFYEGSTKNPGWKSLIPADVLKYIESNPENVFQKVFDKVKEAETKDGILPWKQELIGVLKTFWQLNIFKAVGKIFKEGDTEFFRRKTNFVLFTDPRTIEEMLELTMKRGASKDVAMNIIFRFLFNGFISPFIVTSIVTSGKALISLTESLLNVFAEPFGRELNWVDYNEDNKQTIDAFTTEWVKTFYGSSLLNVQDSTGILDMIKRTLLSQTYIDEISSIVVKLATGKLSKADAESILKTYSETSEKLKKENPELIKVIESVKPNPNNDVIPGSYEAFKQFCASQNPPLTPDADPDGKNNGIYTVAGVEYEFVNTTFIKSIPHL
jgi:hypothetical protein